VYAPPAVGDIDGDGTLDVVVGEYGFGTDVYKVYAWNGLTGEYLPGYPIPGLNSVNNQIILADLDGDEEIELIFDDNTSAGVYHGYNHNGTPMDGWPLYVNGSTFYINPFVADLDGDGIMEISGGGYVPDENMTYLYLWQTEQYMNDDLAILPIFQYNTRHNGVAGDNLMVETLEYPAGLSFTSTTDLLIAPNPAIGYFTASAKFNSTGMARLEVYDVAGKQLLSESFIFSGGETFSPTINTTGIMDGLYTVKVFVEDEIAIGRVLIINP
jgi:hypothetical protein